MNKMVEVFVDHTTQFMPLALYHKGDIFGFCESLNPKDSYFTKAAWTMTAGARSVFALAKLSEAMSNQRLRQHYQIRRMPPKKNYDHWALFREMSQHVEIAPYETEVLFFSQKWFEKLKSDDPSWLKIQHYFLRQMWKRSVYSRAKMHIELMWQMFSGKMRGLHYHCNPYQLETVKQYISMGVGEVPCFMPVVDDRLGPFTQIQDALTHVYGLSYRPNLMAPQYFNMHKFDACGYYSINEPSLVQNGGGSKEISNVMQMSREMKHIINSFKEFVLNGYIPFEDTPIYHFLEKTDCEFYHTEPDELGDLKMSHQLELRDKRYLECGNGDFCNNSLFFRGLMRFFRRG